MPRTRSRRRESQRGSPYNGYSWQQRDAILHEFKRLKAAGEVELLAYLESGGPCEVCRDPDVQGIGWHSEDYSTPYLLRPPAAFIICTVCHQRLHKRFNQQTDWKVFLAHLRAGGFGREFRDHSAEVRRRWKAAVDAGETVEIRQIRPRALTGREWWQRLCLNPESLEAPWARPRPLRPHPTVRQYRAALRAVQPSDDELRIVRAHADSRKRTATMRELANLALESNDYRRANRVYGGLARRLAEHLDWPPDQREDGTPIWMSVVAEGWQPRGRGREYEWVMIRDFASALPSLRARRSGADRPRRI